MLFDEQMNNQQTTKTSLSYNWISDSRAGFEFHVFSRKLLSDSNCVFSMSARIGFLNGVISFL